VAYDTILKTSDSPGNRPGNIGIFDLLHEGSDKESAKRLRCIFDDWLSCLRVEPCHKDRKLEDIVISSFIAQSEVRKAGDENQLFKKLWVTFWHMANGQGS
jgi:hypothetical protein